MTETVINEIYLVHKYKFANNSTNNTYTEKRGMDGLVFAFSGDADWIFEDKTITVCEGDIIYLSPTSKYSIQSKDSPFVHFTANFNANAPLLSESKKITPKNPFVYKRIFEKLTEIWSYKKNGFQLKAKSILYDLIFEFCNDIEFAEINTYALEKITPAKEYIEKHPLINIRTSDLARICNLSETHFRRLFNEALKTSPLDYQINIKIMKAEDLLLTKLYSVKEIAEICGFSDANYFSRIFKAKRGVSPLQFKKWL